MKSRLTTVLLGISIVIVFCSASFSEEQTASPPAGATAVQSGKPETAGSVITLIHLSREKVAAGDLAGALELARRAVSADPAYDGAWKQMGRVLMLRGDYPGALAALKTSLQITPDDAEAERWIIQSLFASDRMEELVSHLERMAPPSREGLDNRLISSIVTRLLYRADLPLAERVLRLSEGTEARNAAAALILLLHGDSGKAEDILRSDGSPPQATRPMYALAWLRLGLRQMETGETEKAVASLQRSLQLEPDWLPALRELGWAYRQAQKPARAADIWERGLRQQPRLISWAEWIVEARIDAGRLKEAEAVAERMLKREPQDGRLRTLKLAILLLRKKDIEAEAFERQLKSGPEGKRSILMAHAFAESHSGHFKEAAALLEELSGAGPADPEVRKLLADTYARWAAGTGGPEALEPLRRLVALTPDDAGAWRDLGWSLWAGNRHDEAIEAWDRAISKGVKDRHRLVTQVVAYLAEQNFGVKAKELFHRWEPGASPLSFGLELVGQRRYAAAREILEEAWEKKEDPGTSGLYLAFAESRTGFCSPVANHLAPFLGGNPAASDKKELDVFFSAVEACSQDPALSSIVSGLGALADSLPGYRTRIVDILVKAAHERDIADDFSGALSLYRIALKQDPNRPGVWVKAFDDAVELGKKKEALAMMQETLGRSSSQAVIEGIKGKLKDESGATSAAVEHYRRSLAADPQQPALRGMLFQDLTQLRRFSEARDETGWFAERLQSGDLGIRSRLAQMYSELGEPAKALDLWQQLYLTYPDTPSYAVGTARALFALCRAGEAVPILERLVKTKPYVRAYELLSEIEFAMNRPDQVLQWTTRGLAIQKTKKLLKMKAEAADMLGRTDVALAAAEAYLEEDPGDALTSKIVARALIDKGLQEKGKAYYEKLVGRNPAFQPGLKALRAVNSSEKNTDAALRYADRLVAERPWDLDAGEDRAVSQAEAEKFRPALEYLRGQASRAVDGAVPILVYSDVTSCPYPGRNTAAQVVSHIKRMAKENYSLIFPDMIRGGKGGRRAVVVVDGADAGSLQKIDSELKRTGGRAIYGCASDALSAAVPDSPPPDLLAQLHSSGRWIIASNGLPEARGIAIGGAAGPGNPLMQKIVTEQGREDDRARASRLDSLLGKSAASLGSQRQRIFLYPGGDYGQLSLDVDSRDLNGLRDGVLKHFDFGIAYDDSGFADDGLDPARLPAFVVPPAWNDRNLSEYLARANPLVRARLTLARTLYLQGQNERADRWFRAAEEAGADPEEVDFHWGSNAFAEGDLPTALEKLRNAAKLNPASARDERGLQRAEDSRRVRVDGAYSGWEDSDNRTYSSWGGNVGGYLGDRVSWQVFSERDRWARKGLGSEEATRLGAALRWYFAEEHWVDAKLWGLHFDNISDHVGGTATLHLPNAPFGGYMDLQVAREEVDTVEAVRAEILANRYEIQTYSRICDMWDLFGNVGYIHRSDGNDTVMLDGLFMRRLHEWPFLGVGYKFDIANSDRNPPEYWAPKGLQEHRLYAAARGEYGRLHYAASGQAGIADETETDWRFVWGGRLDLNFHITQRWRVYGRYVHQETPSYKSDNWLFGTYFAF